MPRRAPHARVLVLGATLAAGALGGGLAVVALGDGAGGGAPAPAQRLELARQAAALPARTTAPARKTTTSARKTATAGRTTKPRRTAAARGPRGPRGPRGLRGPAGRSSDAVDALAVNWVGAGDAAANQLASVTVAGIGELRVVCGMETRQLVLVPAARRAGSVRTVADVTVFQGEGTAGASQHVRLFSVDRTPITLPFPPNGMVTGVLSAEPIGGDGGGAPSPASLTLSSEWKVNDPDAAQNACHVAAQVVKGG